MSRLWPGLICFGFGVAAVVPLSAPAAEERRPAEYVMPWEMQDEPEPRVDVAEPERLEVAVEAMEVVKLPMQGGTVISSHPEVADIYIEDANLLFIFGRIPGTTNVVVGDKELTPVFNAEVTVVPPERTD